MREADDEGDWQAAGCSSSAQWLAQVSSSDHRTAVRITRTSDALRSLPALDHALSTGALTLDQVAAAAEFATPESDAELARVAVGKAPSAIALAARTLAPPDGRGRPGAVRATRAEHDLDARAARARAQRPPAARAGRRLRAGHLEHRQAPARRSTSRPARVLEWQQSAADALVTLARHGGGDDGGVQAQPHHADRAPQRRRSRRCSKAPGRSAPRPPSDSPATHAASRSSRSGRDLVHSRVGRCASYAQQRALHKRSGGHCQYPGCTATRELEAHHLIADEHGGKTELDNLILLCPRHHKLLHDHHIHTSGTGDHPAFTDAGRTRDHHQPATRTTPLRVLERADGVACEEAGRQWNGVDQRVVVAPQAIA